MRWYVLSFVLLACWLMIFAAGAPHWPAVYAFGAASVLTLVMYVVIRVVVAGPPAVDNEG